jgi:hypothetical protein
MNQVADILRHFHEHMPQLVEGNTHKKQLCIPVTGRVPIDVCNAVRDVLTNEGYFQPRVYTAICGSASKCNSYIIINSTVIIDFALGPPDVRNFSHAIGCYRDPTPEQRKVLTQEFFSDVIKDTPQFKQLGNHHGRRRFIYEASRDIEKLRKFYETCDAPMSPLTASIMTELITKWK